MSLCQEQHQRLGVTEAWGETREILATPVSALDHLGLITGQGTGRGGEGMTSYLGGKGPSTVPSAPPFLLGQPSTPQGLLLVSQNAPAY